ncbi:hypothetical protein [Subtercola vilae]|uniref:Uncharacterized protein n=1 Tax=Subtercola vilae TaxID=2056433 RepID=A0A4T2CB92_9MICO|nr:hypothetical protein [Subtercola vilae]TIH40621.1 hypothetical protein D4765_01140 [Subtercola vilae]
MSISTLPARLSAATLVGAAICALVVTGATAAEASPAAPPVETGGSTVTFTVPDAFPSTDSTVEMMGFVQNIGRGSTTDDFALTLKCGRTSVPVELRVYAEGNVLFYEAAIPVSLSEAKCTLTGTTSRPAQSFKFMPAVTTVLKGARIVEADAALVALHPSGGLY